MKGSPFLSCTCSVIETDKEQAGSARSERYSKIKSKISGFSESSEVLLKILEEVKDIHPFIGGPSYVFGAEGRTQLVSSGVAVIAFKAVVSLELKRRENDDKVMFLLVKVQDMMEILVQ